MLNSEQNKTVNMINIAPATTAIPSNSCPWYCLDSFSNWITHTNNNTKVEKNKEINVIFKIRRLSFMDSPSFRCYYITKLAVCKAGSLFASYFFTIHCFYYLQKILPN